MCSSMLRCRYALVTAGADPNGADRDGLTALMFAAGQGRLDLVQSLLRRAPTRPHGAYAATAWHVATTDDVIRGLRESRQRP